VERWWIKIDMDSTMLALLLEARKDAITRMGRRAGTGFIGYAPAASGVYQIPAT